MAVRDTLASVSDVEPTTVAPHPPDHEGDGDADDAPEETFTKTIEQASALASESEGESESENEEDEPTGTETGTVPGVPARLIAALDLRPRDEHTARMAAPVVPPRETSSSSRESETGAPIPYEPFAIPGLASRPATRRRALVGLLSLVAIVVALCAIASGPGPGSRGDGVTPRTPRSAPVVPVGFDRTSEATPGDPGTSAGSASVKASTAVEDDPLGELSSHVSEARPSSSHAPWMRSVPSARGPSSAPRGASPRRGIVRDAPF